MTSVEPSQGSRVTAPWVAGWKAVLFGVAALVLIGIGFAYFLDVREKAQVEAQTAREQGNAARIAAEMRARQLEEQAAADRAARERAEKSQVESLRRLADQAERDRIAKEQAVAFNVAALHRDVRAAVEAARRAVGPLAEVCRFRKRPSPSP